MTGVTMLPSWRLPIVEESENPDGLKPFEQGAKLARLILEAGTLTNIRAAQALGRPMRRETWQEDIDFAACKMRQLCRVIPMRYNKRRHRWELMCFAEMD